MKLTNNLYFYPEQGMFDCNTYVITGSPSIIIDPGAKMFLPSLVNNLHKDGINPEDIGIITNTHLHGDHCGANEAFKEVSGGKIIIHPAQKEFYGLIVLEAGSIFGLPAPEFREDACWQDDKLNAGDIELRLIPSPGHSPDSVCFYNPIDKVLVSGDVVFDQNTGRVDLPGGSADELRKSIENLAQMEIGYLLPGHMGIVSGEAEVRRNFDFIREYILKWL